jgi:hypothetical protein
MREAEVKDWDGLPHNEIPWWKRTTEQQHEWNSARIRREYPLAPIEQINNSLISAGRIRFAILLFLALFWSLTIYGIIHIWGK